MCISPGPRHHSVPGGAGRRFKNHSGPGCESVPRRGDSSGSHPADRLGKLLHDGRILGRTPPAPPLAPGRDVAAGPGEGAPAGRHAGPKHRSCGHEWSHRHNRCPGDRSRRRLRGSGHRRCLEVDERRPDVEGRLRQPAGCGLRERPRHLRCCLVRTRCGSPGGVPKVGRPSTFSPIPGSKSR